MNTPEMRTERLILRRFTSADLPAMHALLADRRTSRFLPWSYSRYTFDSERILRNRFMLRYNDPCGYYYAVCLKDDNIPIGYISVSGDESHELCFALRRDMRGKGYMTEAGKAVLDAAKADGVPYVTATHDILNPKSGNLLRRLGMTYRYTYDEKWVPKDIDVTFPADYHAEELAGKPVVFKVKVHEVKETVVPEKDDEFVKDVSEFDTVAELRADIEKRIRDEKQAGIDRAFENAAVEKAAANMTVEIPDSMIDEELDQEMERMDYELRSQGASLQAYAQMMGGDMNAIRNSLRPSAQAAVRTNVLLDAVAAAENIEVSEEECEEEYKKLAESYKMELDDVKKALNADGLKSDLKLRKAARLIADSAVAVAPKAPEAAEEAPASEE